MWVSWYFIGLRGGSSLFTDLSLFTVACGWQVSQFGMQTLHELHRDHPVKLIRKSVIVLVCWVAGIIAILLLLPLLLILFGHFIIFQL